MYRWLTVVTILICSLTTINLWAKEIIHDPEFVRMEKEFGKQWSADDKLVHVPEPSITGGSFNKNTPTDHWGRQLICQGAIYSGVRDIATRRSCSLSGSAGTFILSPLSR